MNLLHTKACKARRASGSCGSANAAVRVGGSVAARASWLRVRLLPVLLRGAALLVAPLAPVGCASQASRIEEGQKLLHARQYDAAIEQFMAVIGDDPDAAAAHYNLGLVYFELGRFDEALKAMNQARRAGDTEEVLMAIAAIYQRLGDLTQAFAVTQQAAKLWPQNASHPYRLGVILDQMGERPKAIAAYRAALALDPARNDAAIRLGLALAQEKQTDEAIAVLQQVTKRLLPSDPAYAEAQAGLGQVYESAKMVDYALNAYRSARRADESSLPALLGMSRMLRAQGRDEEVIALMQDAIKKQPKDPRLYLELGLAYDAFHVELQAIEALTRAVTLAPPEPQAYAPLVRLLRKNNADAKNVEALLTSGLAALPNDPELNAVAGDLAFARGDFRGAVAAYQRVVRWQQSAEVYFKLAMAQLKVGELQAAKDTYTLLSRIDVARARELEAAINTAVAEPQATAEPPPKAENAKAETPKAQNAKKRVHKRKRGR